MTHPNEFTRTPSNDPPEQVHTDALKRPALMTETKRQGRAGKTSYTNMHKANLGSQLSIFDTGSFTRARPRPNDPLERVHTDALKQPARTILHGRLKDRNEATRESRANELHKCAQSQPPVTT